MRDTIKRSPPPPPEPARMHAEDPRVAIWRVAGATFQNSVGLAIVGYWRTNGFVGEYPAIALLAGILGVILWPAIKSRNATKVGTLGCFAVLKPVVAAMFGLVLR